jgi:hypothetical protein
MALSRIRSAISTFLYTCLRDEAGRFSYTGEETKMSRVIEPRRLTEPDEERPMSANDVFLIEYSLGPLDPRYTL